MKKKLFSILLIIALTACQAAPKVPTPSPLLPTATLAEAPVATNPPTTGALPAFAVDLSQPFAEKLLDGTPVTLQPWTEQPYAGPVISLPLDLGQVSNPQVTDGLTNDQKVFLGKNGFVVIDSQEAQFGDIPDETERMGQPYYLTTDAAFHALHLTFDDLLKALEKQELRPQMISITQAMLDEVLKAQPVARGTALEGDMQQAVAYLSVALKLFDSDASVDASVTDVVSRQVDQINVAGGKAKSVLFPDFEDDYGAYKPVGHYAGDPNLEAYFRGMTWFGRMHIALSDAKSSRMPLILTLALRSAWVENQHASDVWADIHRTLNFVIGPSDDPGPLEYAALMDKVYGNAPTYQDLADDTKWDAFLSQSNQFPAPQINSMFVASTTDLTPLKGWRFMGQRFTLDAFIFQNLIFDKVLPNANNEKRAFPSGLDVASAFGSAPAADTLVAQGVNDFPNYSDQMTKLRQAVQTQPETQWLSRFYDSWLYTFLPVLKTKNASYPPSMRTSAWAFKEMNTVLGSWAELKHDTILYTKMPEMAGGGGPPTSPAAPSYVEPNPIAFYRMAYMARSLAGGLENFTTKYPSVGLGDFSGLSLDDYVGGMQNLAIRFSTLGDIAAKELAGIPLSSDDNSTIISCLGMVECMNMANDYTRPQGEMPKPPIIAAVSGAGDSVLEVGTGLVNRIYVVVPLEGKQEVAQGGVFSYYEFTQPRDQRLTDDEWRTKLAGANPPALPAWAANFLLKGGKTTQYLAFRKGDVYFITEAGDKLNVRDQPSINGKVLSQLKTYDYIEIADGPVVADGYTWWKIKSPWAQDSDGWVVENQDWYGRSG